MAIGTGTALLAGTAIGGLTSLISGSQAASAATHAANVSSASQIEALNYLKEINKMPQLYKEQALAQLGKIYGLTGAGTGGTPGGGNITFVQSLLNDPFYKSLVKEGEAGVLRGASATGGLRSGNTSEALANSRMGVLENLYTNRIAGLQGLAGLPTNESNIANLMGGIGGIQAQGITGAAQAQQQGWQNLLNIGLGSLGLGIKEGLI